MRVNRVIGVFFCFLTLMFFGCGNDDDDVADEAGLLDDPVVSGDDEPGQPQPSVNSVLILDGDGDYVISSSEMRIEPP